MDRKREGGWGEGPGVLPLFTSSPFPHNIFVGQAIGLVAIGLVFRISFSYVMVLGNKFSWLEMALVSIAWLPDSVLHCIVNFLTNYMLLYLGCHCLYSSGPGSGHG